MPFFAYFEFFIDKFYTFPDCLQNFLSIEGILHARCRLASKSTPSYPLDLPIQREQMKDVLLNCCFCKFRVTGLLELPQKR